MKKTILSLLLPLAFSTGAFAAGDFKGAPATADFSVGGLTGLGILDNHPGYALFGTVAKRILQPGFASDIANSVSIEAELGPLFVAGSTAFTYSAHLRWDFDKDENWTFYALGGFGGDVTGDALGDRSEFYPRFGAGAILRLAQNFDIRAEISHELIGVGIIVPLWYGR